MHLTTVHGATNADETDSFGCGDASADYHGTPARRIPQNLIESEHKPAPLAQVQQQSDHQPLQDEAAAVPNEFSAEVVISTSRIGWMVLAQKGQTLSPWQSSCQALPVHREAPIPTCWGPH